MAYKNLKNNSLLIVFLLGFYCISCNPHPFKKTITHSPILSFNVYPNKENYNVGDTIWLECSSSVWLKDWDNTLQVYNYSKVDLNNSNFSIGTLSDTNKILMDGFIRDNSKFNIVNIKGNTKIAPSYLFYILPEIKNDSFQFKVAIVILNKGFYCLGLASMPLYSSDLGNPKIDVQSNDNYIHEIKVINFLINNGISTKYRAIDRGFKFKYFPTPNLTQEWSYDNSSFYFNVVP